MGRRCHLTAWACAWLCIVIAVAKVTVHACDVGAPQVTCSKKVEGKEEGKCQVYNSYATWDNTGASTCTTSAVAYPKNEAELLAAVADAVRRKQKIKVIGPQGHSLPPLMCPGTTGLLISTRHLVRTRSVDVAAGTVTVDAGVNMRQLHDAVAAQGMAFTTSTWWEGVSAAGGISTGAHGSGLHGLGSNLHDYVVGVRLVVPASPAEGYAKVINLTRNDPDLKAASLSLGVLGAISQVTFALERMFKRSITVSLDHDGGLEDRLIEFLNSTAFPAAYWYASQNRVLMESTKRLPANASGNGINKSSYQPSTAAAVHASAENADQLQKTQNSAELCNASRTFMINRFNRGDGFLNSATATTNSTVFPVVGFNHKMVTTGGCEKFGVPETQKSCLPDRITDSNQSVCTWDRRAGASKVWNFEFRVPLRVAGDAIRDIKAIRDHGTDTRSAFCFYEGIGIIFRTLKKSEAYLGPPEDMVTFELNLYRPERPWTPTWKMDVLTEIEQLLHEKYGAHLHWGKSGGYYMDGQARRATVSLAKFLDVRRRFDPDGVFLNEWNEKILGLRGKRVQEIRDGCALERLCKCSHDSHCSPSEGYFCRPGRVYAQARVCRKD